MKTDVAVPVARPQRDLTMGSLGRLLLRLSAPSTGEMALLQAVTVVDLVWLGIYGGVALPAATLAYTLLLVLISPLMGISVGGMALVARYLGAREQRRAEHATMQTIVLMFITVVPIAILGTIFAPLFLRWMGASGELLGSASAYCRVVFSGLLFLEMLPTVNSVIRAAGHPEYTLRNSVVSVGVLAVLEPVLVFGLGPIPSLGVVGAAWASVLGSAAGVAMQVILLRNGSAGLRVHLADAPPDLPTLGRILKVAMPTAAQRFSPNLANAILMRLMAGLGTDVLAAYSIVSRVFAFLQCPSFGIGNAVAPIMGQNLGAGRPARGERATRLGLQASFVVTLAIYVVVNLASSGILGFLTKDVAVAAIATQALRFTMFSGIGAGLMLVAGSALAGAGDAVAPMLSSMAALWLVQLPACWILSRPLGLGALGMWLGIVLGNSAGATIIILQFRRGRWKEIAL